MPEEILVICIVVYLCLPIYVIWSGHPVESVEYIFKAEIWSCPSFYKVDIIIMVIISYVHGEHSFTFYACSTTFRAMY